MADCYLGEIRMFAGDYAPVDWALCDGQLLQIAGNEALYSLIGTTYGGDGRLTFALPDMRGRVPVSLGTSQAGDTYVLGQAAGTEKVILSENQIPEHTHPVHAQAAAGNTTAPKGKFWAGTGVAAYTIPDKQTLKPMNSQAIATTGGSQGHENMMPFMTLSFIIALRGVYPTAF